MTLPHLADILTTLDLADSGDDTFVANQIDNADHDIIGGHIAAQALTRQITAHHGGEILLEALASFSVPVDSAEYQQSLPEVPDPETLLAVEDQLRPYTDEFGGFWNVPECGGAQGNR